MFTYFEVFSMYEQYFGKGESICVDVCFQMGVITDISKTLKKNWMFGCIIALKLLVHQRFFKYLIFKELSKEMKPYQKCFEIF